jgi:hypothetical protein
MEEEILNELEAISTLLERTNQLLEYIMKDIEKIKEKR